MILAPSDIHVLAGHPVVGFRGVVGSLLFHVVLVRGRVVPGRYGTAGRSRS